MSYNNYCTDSNVYVGSYSHDIGTENLKIDDSLITTAEVAELRAKSELLNGAYSKKWINLTTTYIPDLKQNDIISFDNIKWIVREISINYNPPELGMTIKGLRYD